MSQESLLALYDYLAVHPLSTPTISYQPLPSSSWLSRRNTLCEWTHFLLASSCPSSPTPASRIDLYQQRIPLHRRLHHLTADAVYDHTPTANRPEPLNSLSLSFPLLSLEPCPHNPDISLALSFSSLSLVQLQRADSNVRPARRLKDGVLLECSLLHCRADGEAGEATPFVPTCAAWHVHRPGWMLVGSADGWCHLFDLMTSPHRAGVYEPALIVPIAALAASTQPLSPCYSFSACTASVRHIAFPAETSSLPHLLAVASDDGQLVLGLLSKELSSLSAPSPTASSCHPMSYSSSHDRPKFSLLRSAQPHSAAITSLAFCSHSPPLLCTSSKNGTVQLLDASLDSLPSLAILPHSSTVLTVAVAPFLSPQGCVVLASACGTEVSVWEVPVQRGERETEDVDGGGIPLLFVHRLHAADVVALRWQEGQDWLLNSVDRDGVLMVWEMNAACYEATSAQLDNRQEEERRRIGEKRLQVEQIVAHLRQKRRRKEERWAQTTLELSQRLASEADAQIEGEDDLDEGDDNSDEDEEDGAYGDDDSQSDADSEEDEEDSNGKVEASAVCKPLHLKGGRGRAECPFHLARKEPCPDSCPYRAAILKAQRMKRKEREERRVKAALGAERADEHSSPTTPSEESTTSTPDIAPQLRLQHPPQRAEPRGAEARPSVLSPPPSALASVSPSCSRPGCDWTHPASQRCPELSSSSGDKPSQDSHPSQEAARPPVPPQPAKKQLHLPRPQGPPPSRHPLPIHHHQRSLSSSVHRSHSLLAGSHAAGVLRGERASPVMQSPVQESLRAAPPYTAVAGEEG